MSKSTRETDSGAAPGPDDEPNRRALEAIQDALHGLRFGEVTVIVQDGLVVQVNRTERRRLDRVRKTR